MLHMNGAQISAVSEHSIHLFIPFHSGCHYSLVPRHVYTIFEQCSGMVYSFNVPWIRTFQHLDYNLVSKQKVHNAALKLWRILQVYLYVFADTSKAFEVVNSFQRLFKRDFPAPVHQLDDLTLEQLSHFQRLSARRCPLSHPVHHLHWCWMICVSWALGVSGNPTLRSIRLCWWCGPTIAPPPTWPRSVWSSSICIASVV